MLMITQTHLPAPILRPLQHHTPLVILPVVVLVLRIAFPAYPHRLPVASAVLPILSDFDIDITGTAVANHIFQLVGAGGIVWVMVLLVFLVIRMAVAAAVADVDRAALAGVGRVDLTWPRWPAEVVVEAGRGCAKHFSVVDAGS